MNRLQNTGALLVLTALVWTTPAVADDFFGDVSTQSASEPRQESPLRTRFWLQQRAALGLDAPDPGFSRDRADWTRLETEAFGQVNTRVGALRLQGSGSLVHDVLPDTRDAIQWPGYDFTDEQEEARRWQWRLADSHASVSSGDVWLRGGYQTLAWGESETLNVIDVLGRRDETWPGQADIDELRLPVPALLVQWRSSLEAVLLWNEQPHRQPAAGDDFDPWFGLRAGGADITTRSPDNALGVALRWQHSWPGTDLQVILADTNAFQPTPVDFTLDSVNGEPALTEVRLQMPRTRVLGTGLQHSRNSWVWRTEQALHSGVPLVPSEPLADWPTADQWRAMWGADYTGWRNLTITAEATLNLTLDRPSEADQSEQVWTQSLRLRQQLFNDQLALTGQATHLGSGQGSLARIGAEWDAGDHWTLEAIAVAYQASNSDQLLHPYRNQDALILRLRWMP